MADRVCPACSLKRKAQDPIAEDEVEVPADNALRVERMIGADNASDNDEVHTHYELSDNICANCNILGSCWTRD